MGDRANVVMVDTGWKGDQPPKFVYLYTHWGGHDLPLVVKGVLQRRARWGDPSYLARMIFCAMIPAGQEDGETGFGIGSSRPDNEHYYILVDSREERIGFTPEGMEPHAKQWWSFEDFIAMSDQEILRIYNGEPD